MFDRLGHSNGRLSGRTYRFNFTLPEEVKSRHQQRTAQLHLGKIDGMPARYYLLPIDSLTSLSTSPISGIGWLMVWLFEC